MVVTRRTPVPPMPTSRTNSSQPVPRAQAKVTAGTIPSISSPFNNGRTGAGAEQRAQANDAVDDTALKKGGKSKSAKKKGKGNKKGSHGRPSGFFDFLMRTLVLCFTIYTFAVCPDDLQLQSPVCRGLSAYRRLVIEPYILPPIHLALSHPSVAPYIEKTKPYADRVAATAKPVFQRARLELNTRVVPQWNVRVVPLWNKHAVPQLERLDAQIAPYRLRITSQYEHHVGPYLRTTMFTLRKLQYRAHPYIILAAHKTYDGYHFARPYARPVWDRVKALFARLAAVLGAQRRQFVDPHVQQIWERVKELSSRPGTVVRVSGAADGMLTATSSASASASFTSDITSSVSPESVAPVLEFTSVVSPSASVTASSFSAAVSDPVAPVSSSKPAAAADVVATPVSSHVSSLALPASDTPPVASVVSSVADHTGPSASVSEGAASSSAAASVLPVAESMEPVASSGVMYAADHLSSAASAASSVLATLLSDASTSVVEQIIAVTSSAAPSPSEAAADPDFDAFYAELGLDEEPTSSSSAPVPVQSESEAEILAREDAEAEKARRRIEQTAAKRADIESRHSAWEIMLDAAVEKGQKDLRKALVALRKDAAAELKVSREIHEEVDALVGEAEKFLRGAEKYLENLQREARSEEDKLSLWARVTDKVEKKFADRVVQTETLVNGWYTRVLDKEYAEVKRLAAEVKDIADRSQTNIGMDYAYLDDVTHLDWKRYHKLQKTSEDFTALARSIQDGSHPSPPANAVAPAVADLQSEVQDIVVGFETRLRRIKRNGERSFGETSRDVPEDASADDTISILPMEDDDAARSPADVHISPVVVGRSKEEVMDALNRAAEDSEAASVPPLEEQPNSPKALVQELAEEVVAGEDDLQEAVPSVHVEL